MRSEGGCSGNTYIREQEGKELWSEFKLLEFNICRI